METVIQTAALCIAGALLAVTVRQGSPAMALTLTLGIITAVLLYLWPSVEELTEVFRELGEQSGLASGLLEPLYKTLGIALVVRLGRELCRDAGESALAAAVETAGSICALLVALPLLREALEMLLKLME